MTTSVAHRPSPPAPSPLGRLVTQPGRRDERRRRLTRGRRLDLAFLVGTVLVAAGLHAPLVMHGWEFNDDEGTYSAQAWSLAVHGHLSPYTYWYDHPPLGWILLAGPVWLDHALGTPVRVLVVTRVCALLAHLVTCALLYVLARRLGMRHWAAAVAVVLFTASPLSLTYQRMVMLDSLAMPLLVGAWMLALSPQRRLSAAVGSGALLAAAVLVKETVVLAAPFLGWTLVQNFRRAENRRFAWAIAVAAFAGAIATYPMFAILKGELLPGAHHVSLLGAAIWQVHGRVSGGSALQPHTATRGTVMFWISRDGWFLLAAAVAVPVAACRRSLRPFAAFAAVLAVLPLRNGYLPAAQVVAVLLPAAVLVAGAADVVVGAAARAWRRRDSGRLRRVTISAAATATSVAAVAGVALLGSTWVASDGRLVTQDDDRSYRQALAYVRAHVPADDNMLVDDNVWTDLVTEGRPAAHTVWFYKLDLDPTVTRRFPHGWKDIQWVVLTPQFRGTLSASAQVRDAIAHGSTIATYGSGASAVRILRVRVTAPTPE